MQKAKNAYRRADYAAVRRWEDRAFEAATRAVLVNPTLDEARILWRDRQRRVERLLSKK